MISYFLLCFSLSLLRVSLALTGEWEECSSVSGVCIDVNTYTCSQSTQTGLCPGPSAVRCCPSPGGVSYGSCASSQQGLCKRTTTCSTTSVSGLCPGPSTIKCCLPTATPPTPSGDVPVTPGIYLEQNPPAKTQFRARRSTVRPVIVVHTAETAGTASSPDPRAENTASFISRRTTFGSYHLIGDTDSIIQLVQFKNAAFQDGTGSNEWAIGISVAMKAADWPFLSVASRERHVATAAQMAAMAANWFRSQGVGIPVAILLTKEQSDQPSASGFISHARRDPSRRSDPGADFPWADFFSEYQKRI